MDRFKKRLLQREKDIREWLTTNKLELFLEKADEILAKLPFEEIKEGFEKGILEALNHCAINKGIRSLEFEWYYSGHETGGALAYGFDSCKGKGGLSKTDLEHEEISGIESNIEHGGCIDEYFAELPSNIAINAMVNEMNPMIEKLEKQLGNLLGDAETLLTDYFQIWNYKIAKEVCEGLMDNSVVEKLKERAPFWVTMSRHERWPVVIMVIK